MVGYLWASSLRNEGENDEGGRGRKAAGVVSRVAHDEALRAQLTIRQHYTARCSKGASHAGVGGAGGEAADGSARVDDDAEPAAAVAAGSPIANLRRMHRQIKTWLIRVHAEEAGSRVVDLACGNGTDSARWKDAMGGVGEYVGIDVVDRVVDLANRRYGSSACNTGNGEEPGFRARFVRGDAFAPALLDRLGEQMFDVCSCQFALHYSWASEHAARSALANVSALLRPGGIFIGTIVDAEAILRRLAAAAAAARASAASNPAQQLAFGNKLYSITFRADNTLRALSLLSATATSFASSRSAICSSSVKSNAGSGSGSGFGSDVYSGSRSGSDVYSGSGSGSDVYSGSGSGSSSDFYSGSGSNFYSSSGSDVYSGSGSGYDVYSSAGSGSDFYSGSGSDFYSGSGSDFYSGAGSNFYSGSGSSSDFYSGSGSDPDPDSVSGSCFGICYEFYLADAIDHCPEWLVPLPALARLALDFGLHLVLSAGFPEFALKQHAAQSHLQHAQFSSTTTTPSIPFAFATPDEWDCMSLYTVFAFRKRLT